MSIGSVTTPYPIFSDTDGTPLEDGYIYIGDENEDPVQNPKAVYWDKDQSFPATQPIRTIAGYPSRYGTPGHLYVSDNYSITVKNKNQVVIFSVSINDDILSCLNSCTTNIYETIDDLIGYTTATDTTTVNVLGYNEANDNGGGIFSWDESVDKSTANAVTIIDPSVSMANQGTGSGNGCWIRQYETLLAEMAGCVGDGSTNNHDAIELADAVGQVTFQHGTYSTHYNYTFTHHPIFKDGAKIKAESLLVVITITGGKYNVSEQIFTGSGTVAGLKEISPEAWGATVDDNSIDSISYCDKALSSLDSSWGTLYLNGWYYISSEFHIDRGNITIRGNGEFTSGFRRMTVAQTGHTMRLQDNTGNEYIEDIVLQHFGCDIDPTVSGLVTASDWANFAIVNATRLHAVGLMSNNGWDGFYIEGGSAQRYTNIHSMVGGQFQSADYYDTTHLANSCYRFEEYSSLSKHPAEIFFTNFSGRSNVTHQNHTNSILIRSSDGIWFTNGHVGFASFAGVRLEAIDSNIGLVYFNNMIADGGSVTMPYGFSLVQSGTNEINDVDFTACIARATLDYGFRAVGTYPYIHDISFNGLDIILSKGTMFEANGVQNIAGSNLRITKPDAAAVTGMTLTGSTDGARISGIIDDRSGYFTTTKNPATDTGNNYVAELKVLT